MFPITCSFSVGAVVQIPTLPLASICIPLLDDHGAVPKVRYILDSVVPPPRSPIPASPALVESYELFGV